MSDDLRAQIDALFSGQSRIGADSNTRALLEEARELGMVRRTGGMRMRPPTDARPVKLLGRELPIIGALYDEYEIVPRSDSRPIHTGEDTTPCDV